MATKKTKPIVLTDAVLWAVLKKGWFSSQVYAVFPSRTRAQEVAKFRESAGEGTFVVQRALLVLD